VPTLPSGLDVALSRDAIIVHDGNWFSCPEGHFWYWEVDQEIMGTPPFDPAEEIYQAPQYAKVPTTREEAARFIRVLEMKEEGTYGWRGEWLVGFPSFRVLSSEDAAAWNSWLNEAKVQAYLDETIELCAGMADVAKRASGWGHFTGRTEGDEEST
jgi:hypothetical protein